MCPTFAAALPLALLSLQVAACGGGSGSSLNGVVAGSYYKNARVCLDNNGNGRCDAGEYTVTTGNDGSFALPGDGPVVAEIGTDAVRIDPVTGSATVVTAPLVFRAPAGANQVVSVISTELQAMMDDNGGDAGAAGNLPKSLRNRLALERITNVVVIYGENRSFDNRYGLFPGANGIANSLARRSRRMAASPWAILPARSTSRSDAARRTRGSVSGVRCFSAGLARDHDPGADCAHECEPDA